MNKLTKIGVSALAGSLAVTAAHAAEGSVSVSTGFAFASTTDETAKSTMYQFDSVTFSASGETDGGLTVSASMELITITQEHQHHQMVWITEVYLLVLTQSEHLHSMVMVVLQLWVNGMT